MEFIYLSQVLCPLNIKGRTQTQLLSHGFDSSVGSQEHCTGNTKVVGLNLFKPEFLQVIFSVLWLHLHLSFFHPTIIIDNKNSCIPLISYLKY